MYKEFRGYIGISDTNSIPLNLLADLQPVEYINIIEIAENELLDDEDEKYVSNITFYLENNIYYVRIYYFDGSNAKYLSGNLFDIKQDLEGIFPDGIYCGCKLSINSLSTSLINIMYGFMDFSKNYAFLYLMDSPKNKLKKSLIWVCTLPIKYNHAINYRRLSLDLKIDNVKTQFNYAYITVLNRFYFVNDITLIQEYSQCDLSEDVLMTWKDVIYLQTAFVERSESNYDVNKVDDLVTFDYDKQVTYTSFNLTQDIYKIEDSDKYNFIVDTVGG